MTRTIALAAVLVVGLAACGNGSGGATNDKFSTKATKLVDDLAAGKFTAVTADFDETMKARLSQPDLANSWRTYQELVGKYKSHGAVDTVKKGALTVERVTITTVDGSGEVRVTYHPDGTIAGLFFLKSDAPPP